MRRITAETVLPRLFAVVANEISPSDLLSVDRTHAGISVGEILARAGRSALRAPPALMLVCRTGLIKSRSRPRKT